MRYSLLYGAVLFLCVSCSKGGASSDHDGPAPIESDDTYPVVVVNTPTDNQVLANGSVINVTGTVSDNSLFQGSITIRNETNGLIMKDQYYEIHYIPSYNFQVAYTATVSAATDYTITVKFEDHGHNQTVKTVKVKVNP